MELYSVNLIKGFNFGFQFQSLDEDEYLIVSLCIVEIILVW
jgi:hypothetical protein